MQATASDQAIFDSAVAFSASQTFSTQTEKLVVDQPVAGSLTAHVVNVGIPDTTKVLYWAIRNVGTGDCTFKIDSGTIVTSLKAGDAMVLNGQGAAGAILATLAGAATCNVIKVTTSTDPVEIQIAALIIAG